MATYPPHLKNHLSKTNKIGHSWRSKNELINDIWTPRHACASVGDQQELTYINSVPTGYSLKDLPGAMDGRNRWKERVWEICAVSMT